MSTAEIIGTIIAVIVAVPAVYFAWSRFIRRPHRLAYSSGNVTLVRVVSQNVANDEKLALIIGALSLTNTSPEPLTVRDVSLRYRVGTWLLKERETPLASVPTGDIDGKQAIVLANTEDKIIIAWQNLWDTLAKPRLLQRGEPLRGDAVFILDEPAENIRRLSGFQISIRDYSGRRSTHKFDPTDGWYTSFDKNISLIDDQAVKSGDEIGWQTVSLTNERPSEGV